jgi:hypothetical protein
VNDWIWNGCLGAAVVSRGQKRGACACVDVGASRMADALGRRNKDGTTTPADAVQAGDCEARGHDDDDDDKDEGQRPNDRMRPLPELPEGWPWLTARATGEAWKMICWRRLGI